MEHCGRRVDIRPHVLEGTEDRLPGAVTRYGYCRPCREVGLWTGFCERGHALDGERRYQPCVDEGRTGPYEHKATVCNEGDCFAYDQGWLDASQRLLRASSEELAVFVERLRAACAGVKYRSPKTTWADRLRCDLLKSYPSVLEFIDKRQALLRYERQIVLDRAERSESDADPYGTDQAYLDYVVRDLASGIF